MCSCAGTVILYRIMRDKLHTGYEQNNGENCDDFVVVSEPVVLTK